MEPLKNKVIIRPLKKFSLKKVMFLCFKVLIMNLMDEELFSTIKCNKIKAWKRHLKMTMNLIVPLGNVKFIFMMKKHI